MEQIDSKSGEQGSVWRKWTANVQSPGNETFQFVIQALVADDKGLGDIAVDDFVFHENCM